MLIEKNITIKLIPMIDSYHCGWTEMSAFLIVSFNFSSKELSLHPWTKISEDRMCGARLLHG